MEFLALLVPIVYLIAGSYVMVAAVEIEMKIDQRAEPWTRSAAEYGLGAMMWPLILVCMGILILGAPAKKMAINLGIRQTAFSTKGEIPRDPTSYNEKKEAQ